MTASQIAKEVQDRYSRLANLALDNFFDSDFHLFFENHQLGAPFEEGPNFGPMVYELDELAKLPKWSVLTSLGCGSPTRDALFEPGQTVCDLGCGGAIDSILAAKIVGSKGRVLALDFSHSMVRLAERNTHALAGAPVLLVTARMESIPLRSQSVDHVISNSAMHLSVSKHETLREVFRILVPGGFLRILDLVADAGITPESLARTIPETNATAGVMERDEYNRALVATGFTDVKIERSHEVAPGISASVIAAARPRDQGSTLKLGM